MRPLLLPLALVAAPLAAAALPHARQDEGASTQDRFGALVAANDHDGMVALWREAPGEALFVIDAYLEGSLAIREQEEEPDEERIAAMHAAALTGARAADEALGEVLFGDYVSSFVAWDAEQQERFRRGQKTFGQAREALKAGDHAAALAAAEESLSLARPLGDWWGTGMALSAMGDAYEGLGDRESALEAHSESRLVHASLHLAGSEARNLLAMARLCTELGRFPRAELCVARGLALAGDELEARTAFLGARAALERAEGQVDDAAATERELAELRGE